MLTEPIFYTTCEEKPNYCFSCPFGYNREMFSMDKKNKMKERVLTVNNSLGAIMDAQAIADAYASGHSGGQLHLFNFFCSYFLPCVNSGHRSPIIKHFSHIQKRE